MLALLLLPCLALTVLGRSVPLPDEYTLRRCHRPPVAGMCMAYFRKWHYDAGTGTCKQFVYGGCQGNNNNFNTQAQCMAQCSQVPPCYAPTSMPSVPSGCTFNSYTKRRDGCTGYYVHCPNARPRGQCPAVRQTINIPADCSLKQYRGADGCLYLIQDCDGGSGSSSPPVGLTISG